MSLDEKRQFGMYSIAVRKTNSVNIFLKFQSAEKSLRFYANNKSTTKHNTALIHTELENIQKFITKELDKKLNRNIFDILCKFGTCSLNVI